MKRPHQISKLIFEINVPDVDNAYALQNEASSFIRHEIDQVLNELLDQYDLPDQIIHIESLEIDLSSIQFNTQGRPLMQDLFKRQIKEQLSEIISEVRHSVHHSDQQENTSINTSRIKSKVTLSSAEEDETKALIHFLLYGHLPWWAQWMTEFHMSDVAEKLFSSQPEKFLKSLQEHLHSEKLIKRMVNHIRLPLLHSIARQLNVIEKNTVKKEIITGWLELNPDKKDTSKLLHALTTPFYENQISHWLDFFFEPDISTGKIVRLLNYFPDKTINYEMLLKGVASMKAISSAQKKELLLSVKGTHPWLSNEENIIRFIDNNEAKTTAEVKRKNIPESKPDTENPFEKEKEEIDFAEAPENFIAAPYAGLVLLQPYLVPLFKELGLINTVGFTDSFAQQHAVYILYYLATGLNEFEEEQRLIIPKLLCGMDWEEPLDDFSPLSEKEMEECENLIKSVIENWSAIKNTSPQGLREMFLKRNGQLRHEQNGWVIFIEREAADILIDKLPWTISMLRSFWNKEMIYVEW